MIYKDIRGELHSLKNIPFNAKETLISINEKNVFRGFHLSKFAKFIYIIEGEIIDYYIDIENNKINKKELKKGDSLYIPANYAHGFYCNEKSIIMYNLEENYKEELNINIYYNTPEFNLNLNIDPIISEKDNNAYYYKKYKYLILGSNGYLGSHLIKYLNKDEYLCVNTRLNNINEIKRHIEKSRANYVICAAGISGRPTIEWCETNKKETYETNYLNLLELMRITNECNVHLTILGSGLVYNGEKENYNEEDIPNLYSNVYSKFRIYLENIIREEIYKNVLYLRILYPITFDNHPKCFLRKTKEREMKGLLNDINVCITIVPELFPKIPILLEKNKIGIYNFVNKGNINLYDMIYKKINNKKGYVLDISKLENDVGEINDISKIITSYNY